MVTATVSQEFFEAIGFTAEVAGPSSERRRSTTRDRANASDSSHGAMQVEPTVRVGLVLYVSAASPHSQRALTVLRSVVQQCEAGQVGLKIVDMAVDPAAGNADKIAYTPTLVKEFPAPKAWVVGNLENPQLLLDLLREYLVDCSDGRGNGHEQLNAKKPTVQ